MIVACSTAAFRTGLDEALAEVARLGFSHVDLIAIEGWDHVNLERLSTHYDLESGRVKSLLEKHGLTPFAVNFGVDTTSPAADARANGSREATVEAMCRLMSELGVGVGAFYPGYHDDSQSWCPPREDVEDNALHAYRQMLAIARGYGLTIGPEPHCWSVFETPQQVRRLFAALPEISVVYDASHFLLQGLDLAETEFVLTGSHHIHLRGAAKGLVQTAFDRSPMDLEWLFKTMAKIGYRGGISIEYLPDFPGDVGQEIAALRDTLELLATEWRPSPSSRAGG
jgi:sugar phosphate isomerase/epimerase